MAYKPKKHLPGMFSFMNPLSEWVWLSVLGAYVAVSAVFYLIYRLTSLQQPHNNHTQSDHQFIPHQNQQRINGELHAKFAQHQQAQDHTHTQMYLIQKKQKSERLPVSNFLWMAFAILTNNRTFVSRWAHIFQDLHNSKGILNQKFAKIYRSIAGKFASTVWWMFALILVSVYTGNYIAIRLRNKAANPIKSAWDLVDRAGIQYGTLQSGSTYDFFKV